MLNIISRVPLNKREALKASDRAAQSVDFERISDSGTSGSARTRALSPHDFQVKICAQFSGREGI